MNIKIFYSSSTFSGRYKFNAICVLIPNRTIWQIDYKAINRDRRLASGDIVPWKMQLRSCVAHRNKCKLQAEQKVGL